MRQAIAGPLVVATDASEASDAALRAARAIAAHTGQQVLLVAVHEPLPMASADGQIAAPPGVDAERRDYLWAQVRDQVERVCRDEEWPLDVLSGDPAATIATLAEHVGAALVIMGLGGHGLFERILGDETVLKVLRLGTVPVLAVAPDFNGLPQNVLAAVDFSASSGRAVSFAADLMGPGGRLTLAHVVARDLDGAKWLTPHSAHDGTLGHAFDLLTADVGLHCGEQIKRKVLAGDPQKELVAYSDRILPDLIVTGSHGHGFLSRLVIGSVSQHLVRAARCSVLVVPPQVGPNYLNELPEVTTRFAAYEWAEHLEEFTRRNVGRLATLEVIDPEQGAHLEQTGCPFVGASFDPRGGRVDVRLGGNNGTGGDLTRCISGATAMQVLRDRTGRDLMLRVAHGRGQTLLTLER